MKRAGQWRPSIACLEKSCRRFGPGLNHRVAEIEIGFGSNFTAADVDAASGSSGLRRKRSF